MIDVPPSVARHAFRTVPGTPHRLTQTSKVAQFALRSRPGERLGASDRNYNLTVSHSNSFVWFRVAKCGTRSTLLALRRSAATLDMEHAHNVRYSTKLLKGYFTFGFVRHPLARFESCWKDKVVRKNYFRLSAADQAEMTRDIGSFVTFVETLDLDRCDIHLRRQTSLLPLDQLDFVGRVETFGTDLATVFRRVGLQLEDVPKENAAPPTSALAASPAPVRERIERMYARDFDQLGYRASGSSPDAMAGRRGGDHGGQE
jgi:hypothetical protein